MRDVNSTRGLHVLRSMHSTKKRSIPRVQSSSYLDMYMLNKEKERLLKETERLGMRSATIKKRLDEIDRDMNKLQEAETRVKASAASPDSSGPTFTQKQGVKKEWKKMSLSY